MKILSWSKGIVCCILLQLCFLSSAKAITVQCDGCSDWDMTVYATNEIYSLQMYGPLYIFDLQRGVVKKYAFFTDQTEDTDPEFDPINHWVGEISVEPQLRDAILQAHQIQLEFQAAGLSEYPIPLDPTLPRDAGEALDNPYLEDNIATYISQNNNIRTFTQRLTDLMAPFAIPFFNPGDVRLPITLVYTNGDTAIYTYNKETGKYEYRPKSSRDFLGNIIPDVKEDVDGSGIREYTFGNIDDNPQNNEAYDNMMDRISTMNVPIYNVSNPPRGASYFMTCAGDICTVWVVY